MIPILLSIVSALGAPQIAAAMSGSCGGPDIAIVSVTKSPPMMNANQVNVYHVSVTARNVGGKGQPGNALDSIAMYIRDEKTDVKGLQPLAAGASQTVVFTFHRSADAGRGTTNLRFAMQYTQPAMPDCNASNDVMNARI